MGFFLVVAIGLRIATLASTATVAVSHVPTSCCAVNTTSTKAVSKWDMVNKTEQEQIQTVEGSLTYCTQRESIEEKNHSMC